MIHFASGSSGCGAREGERKNEHSGDIQIALHEKALMQKYLFCHEKFL
jgi:hypothetical protein